MESHKLFPHLQSSASGPGSPRQLILKTEARKALKASTFPSFLLVRWPFPTSIGPIFSSHLLLLLTYFLKSPSCVAQHWPVSTLESFGLLCFLLEYANHSFVNSLWGLALLLQMENFFFFSSSTWHSLFNQALMEHSKTDSWGPELWVCSLETYGNNSADLFSSH